MSRERERWSQTAPAAADGVLVMRLHEHQDSPPAQASPQASSGISLASARSLSPPQPNAALRCYLRLFFSALICSSTFFSSFRLSESWEMRCSSSAMCASMSSTAAGG